MFDAISVGSSMKASTKHWTYSSRSQASRWPQAWHILAAVIPLVCLRVFGLNRQSLWFDEGYTLQLASASSIREFTRTFGNFTTSEHLQPLYYVLIFVWSRIAGVSDFALRLPSALFSVISGLCIYRIVLMTAEKSARTMALVAVGLFSCLSYSIYYAQEARPYALIQCVGLLFVAEWIALSRDSSKRSTSGYVFTTLCALAVASSVFNILLVVSLACADLLHIGRQSDWRRTWLKPLAASSLVLAAYAIAARCLFPSVVGRDFVAIKQPIWMNLSYTAYGVLYGTTLGPSDESLRSPDKFHALLQHWPILLIAVVACLLLITSMLLLALKKNIPAEQSVLYRSAAIYVVTFIGIFGLLGHLNILPRHASALFVLCIAILAVSVGQIPSMLESRPVLGRSFIVAMALCTALNLASVFNYFSKAEFRKDDYRAVAESLPNDGLPVIMPEGQAILMKHYGVDVIAAADVAPNRLAHYISVYSQGDKPVRIVVNTHRNNLWDKSESVAFVLRAQYECANEQTAAHMVVMRCLSRNQSIFPAASGKLGTIAR